MNRSLVLAVLAMPLLAAGPSAVAADAPRMSLDPKNFDRSVSACTDFFQYTAGGILEEEPRHPGCGKPLGQVR